MAIVYANESDLSPEEFIEVLNLSTLGLRRPVSDLPRISAMLKGANIIVTARDNGALVGVSRAISDFSYCTYLSDLAVAATHQGQGIGKALIQQTHQTAGLETTLILLAAPGAATYYPYIGMTQHQSCWIAPKK